MPNNDVIIDTSVWHLVAYREDADDEYKNTLDIDTDIDNLNC